MFKKKVFLKSSETWKKFCKLKIVVNKFLYTFQIIVHLWDQKPNLVILVILIILQCIWNILWFFQPNWRYISIINFCLLNYSIELKTKYIIPSKYLCKHLFLFVKPHFYGHTYSLTYHLCIAYNIEKIYFSDIDFLFETRKKDIHFLIHEVYFVKLKFCFFNIDVHLWMTHFQILIVEFQNVIIQFPLWTIELYDENRVRLWKHYFHILTVDFQ